MTYFETLLARQALMADIRALIAAVRLAKEVDIDCAEYAGRLADKVIVLLDLEIEP